jgi:hypothetical protein
MVVNLNPLGAGKSTTITVSGAVKGGGPISKTINVKTYDKLKGTAALTIDNFGTLAGYEYFDTDKPFDLLNSLWDGATLTLIDSGNTTFAAKIPFGAASFTPLGGTSLAGTTSVVFTVGTVSTRLTFQTPKTDKVTWLELSGSPAKKDYFQGLEGTSKMYSLSGMTLAAQWLNTHRAGTNKGLETIPLGVGTLSGSTLPSIVGETILIGMTTGAVGGTSTFDESFATSANFKVDFTYPNGGTSSLKVESIYPFRVYILDADTSATFLPAVQPVDLFDYGTTTLGSASFFKDFFPPGDFNLKGTYTDGVSQPVEKDITDLVRRIPVGGTASYGFGTVSVAFNVPVGVGTTSEGAYGTISINMSGKVWATGAKSVVLTGAYRVSVTISQ